MEYYSHTNNKILIAHFPGHTKIENADLINELKETKITIPNNIDIISIMLKETKENAPLNYQLNLNNIDYINPLKNSHILWKRLNKPKYILKALEQSTKEYSLILDGNDVIILSDLTNIVPIFETYNKKIIFNSTIWMYPHVIIDNVENRGQYGEYCYLNAGCCFGKTKDLIDFYKYTIDIIENTSSRSLVDSEQYYIRKAFDKKQDDVFFDYECKIFQCWHKAEYSYNEDQTKCFLR